jgi:hypothetical protein
VCARGVNVLRTQHAHLGLGGARRIARDAQLAHFAVGTLDHVGALDVAQIAQADLDRSRIYHTR